MSRLYKDIVCTLEDANSSFDSDGFIATTAEGHLLVVDYNIFTKRAYVKYPIYENSVQILSQVFAWLDANGFLDELILEPSKFIEDFSVQSQESKVEVF